LDEEDYEIGEDDEEEEPRIGARPQRGVNIKTKVTPMPEASSLFIFSSKNPYEAIFTLMSLQSFSLLHCIISQQWRRNLYENRRDNKVDVF